MVLDDYAGMNTWIKPIPSSPRHGVLNDIDTQRVDDMLRNKSQLVSPAPTTESVVRLQEDLKLAEHRAFAAEVTARRAQQKRRNQRKQLKQLHAAISEKNNRIRNLEALINQYGMKKGEVDG